MEKCKIAFWNEIFEVERAGQQLNINEPNVTSPTKRMYLFSFYLTAQRLLPLCAVYIDFRAFL